MGDLSASEMLGYIREFTLTMHDYCPVGNVDVPGCFNTKYHGNLCQAVINPPVNEENPDSYPRMVIAYIVANDGDIFVTDTRLDTHKLTECLGPSIQNVYESIALAKQYKAMYENEKKGEV